MECGKRVGKGTITYPCKVTRTKETPDPEFGGFHEGPCAAVENQQSMAVRERWESGAQARATLHAHQSAPQTFSQTHGAHDPTPVPGSGLQPAEHRATYRPVVGGFGEQPVAGPPCQHPFGALYTGADGSTICGECNERLREPQAPAAPQGTLSTFVEEHQAPPEVLAARAEAIPRDAVWDAMVESSAAMGAAVSHAVASAPPPIEGAEPFPAIPAAPPRFIDPPPIDTSTLTVGTEIAYVLEGHANRGTIIPSQEGWKIPEGSYAVQRDGDGSVWSVAPEAITAVWEKASDTIAIGRNVETGDPIGFHKTEPPITKQDVEANVPTKQRPGDQQLPNEGNPRPSVQSVIIAMAQASEEVGIERYGQALKPLNGRDTFQDLVDEARDFFVYGTCLMMERDEILTRFERAYSSLMAYLGQAGTTPPEGLTDDLDAVLAWLRGTPQT